MTTTLLDRARSLSGRIDELAAETPAGEPVAAESLQLLVDAGLRGLLVPKAAGGLELPLVEVADLYEEVARADGSTAMTCGSTVTTSSGAASCTPPGPEAA